MTTEAAAGTIEAAPPGEEPLGRRIVENVKGGNLGNWPVVLALGIMVLVFSLVANNFFTAVNFNNIITQMAGTTLLAYGVVWVLLLGEIDLSVAYVSGFAGVVVAELQVPGSGHDFPGLIAIALALATGASIGLVQGSLVALIGVPSFVVTLAGLLICQAVILQQLGFQGTIGIQDKQINDVANYVLTKNTGWIVAIVFTIGLVGASLGTYISRRRSGLPTGNLLLTAARVVFFGGLAFAVVAICNHAQPRPGLPLVGLILLFLVVLGSYVAGRTTFGRHVYAVGGNAEAARRAGINVKRIRILVFMISGSMAAMGGIIFASRLNGVDLNAGGGTILLDAISAAVIGGVSLFGGRGRVTAALFGGVIIGTISNGNDLVGYSDWLKYLITGSILLAAVTLDTVARRRQATVGR